MKPVHLIPGLALALVLAACGGDDEPDPADNVVL